MYDNICYTLSHYCKWYMQLFQNGPVIVGHVPGVTPHLYYCSLKYTHPVFLATSRSHEHLPSAHKLLVAVYVSLCHHNRNTSMKKVTKMVCGTKRVHMRFLLHLQYWYHQSAVITKSVSASALSPATTASCSTLTVRQTLVHILCHKNYYSFDKEKITFCTQQYNAPLFLITITSLHISHCLGFKLMMCYPTTNPHPTTTQLNTHKLLYTSYFCLIQMMLTWMSTNGEQTE